MKNNLLVTLADENYIDQAKQLFSGAYFNAGWKGDYMLLSHNIPEEKLKWFRVKGILIYKCKPLIREKMYSQQSPIMLDKFYFFTSYFKKWKKIIYLDSDIIVRASLNGLLGVEGFGAVADVLGAKKVSQNFIKNKKINELKKQYDLSKKGFNGGVFVLDTKSIRKDDFKKLMELAGFCKDIVIYSDQSIMNLFFNKNWISLPLVYNSYPTSWMIDYNLKKEDVKGILLHFNGNKKPWDPKNPFYGEWKQNLERAKFINLDKPQPHGRIWNENEINEYRDYIKRKYEIYWPKIYVSSIWHSIWQSIDINSGLLGIYLKKNFPKIYYLFKNRKNGTN
jgi:lipopolysaccharide biosynthesis glycosyltransferase